ncbi:MAG: helix-turn-helix domain-containing protein, partial [Paracoccaceae bacterium]|nr:helix-turn-helix domain-containing protein [Paracoccaceae bacterium]
DTDLRIRLEALRVVIPALKERPEDIPVIFREYVQRASEQANIASPEITPEVVAGLMAQEWPGNARALMNAAIRFALGVEQEQKTGELGLVEKLAQVERTLIVDALQKNHGNASATASQLLLPRKTFYDKLTKHGIRPENYR